MPIIHPVWISFLMRKWSGCIQSDNLSILRERCGQAMRKTSLYTSVVLVALLLESSFWIRFHARGPKCQL
jgi:hypothetical protein